jgi:hypothetical protein
MYEDFVFNTPRGEGGQLRPLSGEMQILLLTSVKKPKKVQLSKNT